MNKNHIRCLMTCFFLGISVLFGAVSADAADIKIDGDITEWSAVDMQQSGDKNVEKWAIAKDDEYVYMYIQQNGGNQWWLPVTSTAIDIQYASGATGKYNRIIFAGMLELKDGWYGDIQGAKAKFDRSQEKDKYEIEVAIPVSFFQEESFSLTYCGTEISSDKIPDTSVISEPEPEEAVYKGITIDGSFKDWDAVNKTDIDNEALESMAAVFDGDWFYIYIKEKSDGAATWSGACSSGHFTIRTDLGYDTNFKLRKDKISGIDGAKVEHSNLAYEVAIPASAIKNYKDTVSFGYYMSDDLAIQDIADLQGKQKDLDKSFNGITYDGQYGDWDYYPHTLIEYSTEGGTGGDAAGALYVDGTTLFGHVESNLHVNEGEFRPFSIRFNESEKTTINFNLVTFDKDGNLIKQPDVAGLDEGTYEFYLWDLNSGSSAKKLDDEDLPVYGKIKLTVGKTKDEVEYQVDLEKVAEHFDMDAKDFKLIQAQYINIGTEWVSIAGTSTGAPWGVALCGLMIFAVPAFRKIKNIIRV